MPSFQGQLKDKQITAIIEMFKHLDEITDDEGNITVNPDGSTKAITMTTTSTTTPQVFDNYLNHTKGIRSWLFTLDHKRIGVMYLICVLSLRFC